MSISCRAATRWSGSCSTCSVERGGCDENWWPFVANQWAWLFLLLVPLVIFYFLKLKRPRLEIPSLALWRSVLNDQRVNSPFQRFKRNILLLLQILLLMFVVLAAMQPFFPSGAERARYLPILIDTSASMAAVDAEGKSRLDEVKLEVRKLIDNMLSDQRFCLIVGVRRRPGRVDRLHPITSGCWRATRSTG